MTSGANTNLNNQHRLHLSKNGRIKELLYSIGRYGEEFLVYAYAYALLAFAHAEGARKLYLVPDVMLSNQILKLLIIGASGQAKRNTN